MAGYTRQSTFADDDVIEASHHNNEYNQLVSAFDEETGHKHDGTANEGPVINTIGDYGLGTPLNKVVVDTNNDRIGVFVDVAAASVEQVRFQDGAILPVTDNDVDLGSPSLEFKNGYFDGTVYLDAMDFNGVGITAVLDEDAMTSNSDTSLATQQSIRAYVNSATAAVTVNNSNWSGTDLAVTNGGTGASTLTGYVKGSGTSALTASATIPNTDITGLGSLATASTVNDSNWSGTDLAVANGGTGGSSPTAARANLGLAIGSNIQEYDAGLQSIAGLTTSANKMIYTSGSDTYTTTDLSAAARTLLDDASVSAMRTTLEVVPGTHVQAYDAGLQSISGLTTLADRMIYTTASDTYAVTPLTSAGRSLIDDATVGDMRTTLGLAIGTNVQAWDADLDTIAGLAKTDSNFIVGNGSAWVAESGATARTSLGLGSLATASTINNSNWSGTDLAVTNGGTGASDAATARTNLGVGSGDTVTLAGLTLGAVTATSILDQDDMTSNSATALATQQSIKAYVDTATTGFGTGNVSTTGTVVAADWAKFTNATTVEGRSASEIKADLDLEIGTDLQAWDANLDQIAALTPTDSNFVVGNGSAWVAESGATARTSLGAQAQSAGLDAISAAGTQATADYFLVSTGTANGVAWETPTQARTSLGLGSLAQVSTVNDSNWSGTDLSVANGGTGSSTQAGARTNLGVAIGSDVQAYNANLAALATLGTPAGTDLFVVSSGVGTFVYEDASTARASLGLGSLATASTINNSNWSGTDLSVANGGTGGSDISTAQANLNLVPGTHVQAWDAQLQDLAGLATTDGNFIVGNGTNWVAESGSTARTSLGLGTIATQNSNNATITGGNITGLSSLGLSGVSDTATTATHYYVETSGGNVAPKTLANTRTEIVTSTAVDTAGAVMNSDTSTAAMSFVVDDDTFADNSATKVPTQQSVKAYVDAAAGSGGSTMEVFTSSGTWTKPSGVTVAHYMLVSAGGGGSSARDIGGSGQVNGTSAGDSSITGAGVSVVAKGGLGATGAGGAGAAVNGTVYTNSSGYPGSVITALQGTAGNSGSGTTKGSGGVPVGGAEGYPGSGGAGGPGSEGSDTLGGGGGSAGSLITGVLTVSGNLTISLGAPGDGGVYGGGGGGSRDGAPGGIALCYIWY